MVKQDCSALCDGEAVGSWSTNDLITMIRGERWLLIALQMHSFFRTSWWSEMTEWNSNYHTKVPHSTVPTPLSPPLPVPPDFSGCSEHRKRIGAGYWSISSIRNNFLCEFRGSQDPNVTAALHSVLTSVDPSNSTEVSIVQLLPQPKEKQSSLKDGVGVWFDKRQEKQEWQSLLTSHGSLLTNLS